LRNAFYASKASALSILPITFSFPITSSK
jgi:hypothetical protein